MIKILLLLFCFVTFASASEITSAFKAQDYEKVSTVYKGNPDQIFSAKELVYISFSLRKLGFYRQDIKLNKELIKKSFSKEHQLVLSNVRKGITMDGEDFPKGLKVLYWNIFNNYGYIIEGYNHKSKLVEGDLKAFKIYGRILSEFEFRESQVDKITDKISGHLLYLENKIYKFVSSWSIQYVSWQRGSSLVKDSVTGLIITNRGICPGLDAGVENYLFHFYVDGCLLYGSGGVSENSGSGVDYQQSNVPAIGIKAGPGASMIVSSSRSRIGFRIPVIYTVQKLAEPENGGYKIEEESPLSIVTSLYSRWQFDKWYFQTEFGKYLSKEQTFWGLGIGRTF